MMLDLELIAFMSSRICHDLVSPVGAIANGIEILAEEGGADGDPEMRAQALDLIAQSATQASRRLAFCRMAFGAGGGAEAMLDLGAAARVAAEFLEGGRVRLDWRPQGAAPRDVVKVALALVTLGADCLPRGGDLVIEAGTAPAGWLVRATARAERRTIAPALAEALAGALPRSAWDAKMAPALYAGALARASGGSLGLREGADWVALDASLPNGPGA